MNRLKLKKGISYSVMWALSYRLNIQYPNKPSRKIKGIVLQSYKSYTKEEQDIIEQLKAKAWLEIEGRFEGELNIPILMTELFWSFPDVYGKNIQKWIDQLDDEIISNINHDELLHKSKEATEWYVELIDKVIFDYMKERKD